MGDHSSILASFVNTKAASSPPSFCLLSNKAVTPPRVEGVGGLA